MLDLNATMFYKVKFNIEALDPDKDLLWEIVMHVKEWQTSKWNRHRKAAILDTDLTQWTKIKYGGRIAAESSDGYVRIESEHFHDETQNVEYWACKIVEHKPSEGRRAPREWVTEFGYEGKSVSSGIFSCVLSYRDRPGYIGMCDRDPSPSVPKIIKNILLDSDLRCFSGIDNIALSPIKLIAGQGEDFWEKLCDPNRTLPYIYISPKRLHPEDTITCLISPRKVAEHICGNAIVYYTDDMALAEEIGFVFSNEYDCYGGAIRVYFPQLNPQRDGDSYRHRYLSANIIQEFGEDNTYRIFRKALAEDINFYETFFRVQDCRRFQEEDKRQKRIADLRRHHAEALKAIEDQSFESAMALAREEEEKRKKVEDDLFQEVENNDALCSEIDECKKEIFDLKQQLETARVLAQRGKDLQNAVSSRFEIREMPMTVYDVVQYFKLMFCDRIDFSEDAMKSLKTCELDSTVLWKVLFALATKMYSLYMTGNGHMYDEFKRATGIICKRGEGSMTRQDKKLMRQYETDYLGEKIDIETHITYPREEQSIHFGFSIKHEKIIVGHCGEHLDNYSTQKRH